MDLNWWKRASGTMTHGSNEFQEAVSGFGNDTLVIVDFFMPACGYCVKFMPDWNRVVAEMKAEYGDKIQFLKVDGTSDRHTAHRYSIQSFPSFVMLEPGTDGDKWTEWNPVQRNYANMKKWIKTWASKYHIEVPKPAGSETEQAADQLRNNFNLGAALPLAANQPSAALMQQQMEENKRMGDAIEQLLKQQSQQADFAQTIQENMEHMISTQDEIQLQLSPAQQNQGSNFNTLSVFLGGIVLGTVIGLVFASYLIKVGRIGGAGKKAGKGKGQSQLPPSKDFPEVVRQQNVSASMRSSTQATSDHDTKDEADCLL